MPSPFSRSSLKAGLVAAFLALGLAATPSVASAQVIDADLSNLLDMLGIGELGEVLNVNLGEIADLRLGQEQAEDNIDSIGDQTDTNTIAISELRTTTTVLRADTDRNTADIATLRTDVNTNTASIAALETNDARQDTVLATHTTQIAALEARGTQQIQEVTNRVSNIENRMDNMNERIDTANAGVAMAFAMKTPTVAENKTFAVSGGWGTFEGENAFAVSGAVRATDMLQFDAGIAVGSGSAVGGRAGATLSW